MFRRLRTIGLLASIALVLILALPMSVFAGEPDPRSWGGGSVPDPDFGEGKFADTDIETAAAFLEMEEDELEAQLWAGRTLAEIAEARQADIIELRNAVQAARYRQLTEDKDKDKKDPGDKGKPDQMSMRPDEKGMYPPMAPMVGIPMRTTGRYGLNLRSGPGTRYPVCVNVPCGTMVYYVGDTPCCGGGGWSKIVYNGQVMWAASSYLARY